MNSPSAVAVASPSPREVSSRRLLICLFPAATAMFAMFNGTQMVLLPGQVESVDPVNKIGNLAFVMGISAIAGVLGLLAGGAISDRTTGRWGRRAPSLMGGAVAASTAAVILGAATSIVAIVLLMTALMFSLNYYQAAMAAILPDRIPLAYRGTASSIIALGVPIGVIAGVNIAAAIAPQLALAAFAIALLAGTTALIVFAPEPPVVRSQDAGPSIDEPVWRKLAGFFQSLGQFDFTLVLGARMLMFFSIFSVTSYTYYILQDYVGVANLPSPDVKVAVSLMVTIQMITCLISTAISGWISDRWGRPKLLVAFASLGIAAGFAVPAFSASWTAILVMQASVGFFFGTYMAIDLALASMVLPDRANEGRDMALMTAAGNVPQMITPIFAATVIAHLGFGALFASGAICALLAAIAVLFVKSVR